MLKELQKILMAAIVNSKSETIYNILFESLSE